MANGTGGAGERIAADFAPTRAGFAETGSTEPTAANSVMRKAMAMRSNDRIGKRIGWQSLTMLSAEVMNEQRRFHGRRRDRISSQSVGMRADQQAITADLRCAVCMAQDLRISVSGALSV